MKLTLCVLGAALPINRRTSGYALKGTVLLFFPCNLITQRYFQLFESLNFVVAVVQDDFGALFVILPFHNNSNWILNETEHT